MEAKQYADIAELDSGQNWWYVARRNLVENLLKKYVVGTQRESALDLGCGTGAHASVLKPYARTIIGLDPSEEALQIAHDKGYDRCVLAGAENIPLPDASVDLILCTDV